jgi:acyl-[acyl-carrier-protein]-phospholipid O-acyltransferase / long-chain-fatty-acid--[acyl-carrier-protein] ligase
MPDPDSVSPSFFASRRFLPLFITQFGGAMNDNIFRFAMITLLSSVTFAAAPEKAETLAALSAGLFMLPYFLLSATAGHVADGIDKAWLARGIKILEIFIMIVGLWALTRDPVSVPALLVVVVLLGVHSTFFGPIKYALLPQHLQNHELLSGNSLIEAGTFVAILIGQLLGIWMYPQHAAWLGIAVALLGFAASSAIPDAPPLAAKPVLGLNIFSETVDLLRLTLAKRTTLLTTLGISWVWALGAVITAQSVNYAKSVLFGDKNAAMIVVIAFTAGIAIGSLLISRLLRGKISPKYAPFAALGISLFLIDLYFASNAFVPLATSELLGPFAVMRSDGAWRVLLDLFMVAVCAGAFIVPLYAILQSSGPDDQRSRTIAANNVVNAAFMVIFSLVASLLLGLGTGIPLLLLIFGILNLGFAVLVIGLLPDSVIKSVLQLAFRGLYRVEVSGLENYERAGERSVIVVNHVSFLDGLLLAAFLPGKPCFAVNTFIARQWWVKPFLNLFNAFPVDPTNPMSMKSMVRAVEAGTNLIIFPEGRITVTGALMKVFEGPGMVAEKANADIVPIRLDGAQYTPFSRLRGKVRTRWFPKIKITVLPPRRLVVPPGVSARAKRQAAGNALYDLMCDLIFETCDTGVSLFTALNDARAVHGPQQPVVEDVERAPLSYRRLLAGSIVLGKRFATFTRRGEAVGVLLPNVNAAAVTFFGLQYTGRVPAMMNFTAGSASLVAACQSAQLKSVITSKKFIAQGNLGNAIAAVSEQAHIVYLEDIGATVRTWDRLVGLMQAGFAGWLHKRLKISADDPAVILFTSGSEGLPKGVVLSHRNLLANRYQLSARIDFNPTDIVFNALPVFHSFGLTGGFLLPVLSGIKTVLYPSPLHYRIVPAFVYDSNTTILFGTDTFLSGYARMAHPYDFYAVRYIFAGAEKVKDETRRVFADKFGLRIFEGYGATETAPVIAVNTPMQYKAGTVGRLLPAIDHKLVPVPGIGSGGALHVKGPNVMRGYFKADRPGDLQPPADGWYDTGDIVSMDDTGFITIQGRAKRFAKLGGEMVSLTAVEALAAKVSPGHLHAAVTQPDDRKGEVIVLTTTDPALTADALLAQARTDGQPELMVPKDLRVMAALPVLGTGKIDYVSLEKSIRQ